MSILIDGHEIALNILSEARENLKRTEGKSSRLESKIAIIRVGYETGLACFTDQFSQILEEFRISYEVHNLNANVKQNEIKKLIALLNDQSTVDGIILQYSDDCNEKLNFQAMINKIKPKKDVECLTNAYSIFDTSFDRHQCKSDACLKLIQHATGDLNYADDKHIVIINNEKAKTNNNIAILSMFKKSITTIVNSNASALKKYCEQADILIIDVEKPQLIIGDSLKTDAFLIFTKNISINNDDEKGIIDDLYFNPTKNIAKYIASFSNGFQPVYNAILIKNILHCTLGKGLKNKIHNSVWKLQCLDLEILKPVPADSEISRNQKPKFIGELAEEIGIEFDEVDLYGKSKAKVSLEILHRLRAQNNGKYVVVVGITPTPFGEGKSTAVFGLAQALCAHLKKNAIACVRQPSQGPTFGIKGGAAGGGYAQAIPMEEFNLHLTGDIHAIIAANNLLAAAIDARMFHESTQSDEALFNRLVPADKHGVRQPSKIQKRRLERLGFLFDNDLNNLTEDQRHQFARLNIDPNTVAWNRVIDTNDRFLRRIEIGLGTQEKGHSRFTGFDIAVASELMAILALSDDLEDMHRRISRIVVANSFDGVPITADDIGVTGALTVLLRDTVRPNLMQTLEGTPVFVHTGPFANIAHGQSSIIADKVALKLVGSDGYVLTEAGFGADIGMEKFFNIKCRYSKLKPNAVVLVLTIRALKMHGGGPKVTPGSPLKHEYLYENIELVEAGCDSNLRKQIENVEKFGVPVVVCINKFSSDTQKELDLVISKAKSYGACQTVISNHWAEGGRGAIQLAEAVIKACEMSPEFRYLYELDQPLHSKIEIIAKEIYGADGIELSPVAKEKLEMYEKIGYGSLPICIAKTQYSLSHDPTKKGAPKGFKLPIRDIRAAVGAEYIFPLCGEMQTMPGLPTRPCFFDIDLNTNTGIIEGLI